MFIDQSELDRRLNREENLLRKLHRKTSNAKGREELVNGQGRKPGDKNIPPIIQEIVGTLAHFDKNINVADAFGVSPQQVSNIKNGAVSPQRGMHDIKNQQIQARLEANLSRIRDKAIDKLVNAIEAMTDEKIQNAKIKELGSLAASLSSVVERSIPAHLRKTGPEDDTLGGNKIQLNIYAPQLKEEAHYESVVTK